MVTKYNNINKLALIKLLLTLYQGLLWLLIRILIEIWSFLLPKIIIYQKNLQIKKYSKKHYLCLSLKLLLAVKMSVNYILQY